MARVTVEDCINKIPNRFNLVLIAAQRTKQILSGSDITIPKDNDKNSVISLREIAKGKIDIDLLTSNLIRGFRTYVETDSQEKELDYLIKQDQTKTEDNIEIGTKEGEQTRESDKES